MKSCLIKILLFGVMFSAVLYGESQQAQRSRALEIAKKYEVQEMEKPAWAEHAGKPLFKVAWFSDTHINGADKIAIMKKAFAFARNYGADFAIFTGDNSIYCDKQYNSLKGEVRKHAWFRDFLKRELALPYKVLPGDNWYAGFGEVFGSRNYAFDACGYHFVFASLDARGRGGEGCALFDEATLQWLKADISANAGKPVLFAMHETLWPPTFLETDKVTAALSEHKNVVAVLGGHLHLDLDLHHGSIHQLVAPSLGRSHRPAFKFLRFYEDIVIIESCELNASNGSFFLAKKWQKIDVPSALKPSCGKLDLRNTNAMNYQPVRKDDSLSARSQEVYNGLMMFAISMGLSNLLNFGN